MEIRAAETLTDERRPEGVASFYSGGVDSSYTVLKHIGDPRLATPSHLILVHGFDYDRRNLALRELVRDRIAKVAAGFGVGLVEAETNLRELTDPFVFWGTLQYAPLQLGIGLAMSGEFWRIITSSGISYPMLIPFGGHPGVDPLWSTEATEIVHEGAEASRVEKVAWQVARSDVALSGLRVCYMNPGGAYNCGRCVKCQRTLAALQLAGALDRCPTFDGALPDPELIAAADLVDDQMRDQVREFIATLKADGRYPELETAFEASLSRRSRRARLHEPLSALRVLRNRHAPSLRL
ncbi:MAG: hypothetical protein EXQ70_06110 [Solirubrobacterales bacterium]|nr:hypothetical protein [Solirubrobacterales bacterium]